MKQEFTQAMLVFANMYPGYKLDRPTLDCWLSMFGQIPSSEFQDAFKLAMPDAGNFFPSPGLVMQKLQTLRNKNFLTADEAWQMALGVSRELRILHSKKAVTQKLGLEKYPALLLTIRNEQLFARLHRCTATGTPWFTPVSSQETETIRRDFVIAYREVVRRSNELESRQALPQPETDSTIARRLIAAAMPKNLPTSSETFLEIKK